MFLTWLFEILVTLNSVFIFELLIIIIAIKFDLHISVLCLLRFPLEMVEQLETIICIYSSGPELTEKVSVKLTHIFVKHLRKFLKSKKGVKFYVFMEVVVWGTAYLNTGEREQIKQCIALRFKNLNVEQEK